MFLTSKAEDYLNRHISASMTIEQVILYDATVRWQNFTIEICEPGNLHA